MLSKIARHQLRFWPSNEVATLFGEGTMRVFASAAEVVRRLLAGVVARPLCKFAGARSTHEVCEMIVDT